MQFNEATTLMRYKKFWNKNIILIAITWLNKKTTPFRILYLFILFLSGSSRRKRDFPKKNQKKTFLTGFSKISLLRRKFCQMKVIVVFWDLRATPCRPKGFPLHTVLRYQFLLTDPKEFCLDIIPLPRNSRVEIPLKNRSRFERFERFSSKVWAVWAVFFLEKPLKPLKSCLKNRSKTAHFLRWFLNGFSSKIWAVFERSSRVEVPDSCQYFRTCDAQYYGYLWSEVRAPFPFPPTCKFLHANLLTTLFNCYENLHTD